MTTTEILTDPSLVIPTREDFSRIATLHALAFEEKKCFCARQSDMEKETLKVYEKYHSKHPQKLEHCRIIKSPDGVAIAACQ